MSKLIFLMLMALVLGLVLLYAAPAPCRAEDEEGEDEEEEEGDEDDEEGEEEGGGHHGGLFCGHKYIHHTEEYFPCKTKGHDREDTECEKFHKPAKLGLFARRRVKKYYLSHKPSCVTPKGRMFCVKCPDMKGIDHKRASNNCYEKEVKHSLFEHFGHHNKKKSHKHGKHKHGKEKKKEEVPCHGPCEYKDHGSTKPMCRAEGKWGKYHLCKKCSHVGEEDEEEEGGEDGEEGEEEEGEDGEEGGDDEEGGEDEE